LGLESQFDHILSRQSLEKILVKLTPEAQKIVLNKIILNVWIENGPGLSLLRTVDSDVPA
jgi:hypothetical protein